MEISSGHMNLTWKKWCQDSVHRRCAGNLQLYATLPSHRTCAAFAQLGSESVRPWRRASPRRCDAWCCPSNMCVSQVIAHGKNCHFLKANKLYLSMTTSSVGHFAGSSASEAGRSSRALSTVSGDCGRFPRRLSPVTRPWLILWPEMTRPADAVLARPLKCRCIWIHRKERSDLHRSQAAKFWTWQPSKHTPQNSSGSIGSQSDELSLP